MNGEIGVLKLKDKQVGGFLDWKIDTFIEKGNRATKSRTVAAALSFWMLEELEASELTATFYCRRGDALVVAQEAVVAVSFPGRYYLDKWIKAPLDLVFREQG